MTKVTVASAGAPARRYGSVFHRELAQQIASDRRQKESKRLIISVLQERSQVPCLPRTVLPANCDGFVRARC